MAERLSVASNAESNSRKSSWPNQIIEDAKALTEATDELREIGRRVAEKSESRSARNSASLREPALKKAAKSGSSAG